MEVYLYDDNGFYTETYIAQACPIEFGKYIIPTNALKKKPEFKEGKWPVAVNGKWVLKPDTRVVPEEEKPSDSNQLAYLKSTDWYVLRFIETGVAIPAEILEARKLARSEIK